MSEPYSAGSCPPNLSMYSGDRAAWRGYHFRSCVLDRFVFWFVVLAAIALTFGSSLTNVYQEAASRDYETLTKQPDGFAEGRAALMEPDSDAKDAHLKAAKAKLACEMKKNLAEFGS